MATNIDGFHVRIATSTLRDLPYAVAFITHEVRRGIAITVAMEYARIAAKLHRTGRTSLTVVTQTTERTSLNAYQKWYASVYTARVQPVVQAFADDFVRRGHRWLRVSSLVPPVAGKVIPRIISFGAVRLDTTTMTATGTPAQLEWAPSTRWTLHVPRKAAAIHTDPCIDCVPFELDDAKLTALATAFEDAWGHRDLTRVAGTEFLFGPPPVDEAEVAKARAAHGKIVALLPPGVVADAITALGGSVCTTHEAFQTRMAEGADFVVVGRDSHEHEAALTSAIEAWREP